MRDSELLRTVADKLLHLEELSETGTPALRSLVSELGGESVLACDRVWERWGKVIQMAVASESEGGTLPDNFEVPGQPK